VAVPENKGSEVALMIQGGDDGDIPLESGVKGPSQPDFSPRQGLAVKMPIFKPLMIEF